MIVLYKCSCHKDERKILVPDRVPGSDLGDWMACVQVCLGYDHTNRSPLCRALKVEYVKMEVQEDKEIGTAPQLN